MLNIGIDVDIDIKKVRFPIQFEKTNDCVHCGGHNTLIFVDKFGNDSSKEIHAFDHIRCKKCNRIYSIQWKPDENNSKAMRPVPTDPGIKQEFMNLVNFKNIKENGIKELPNT